MYRDGLSISAIGGFPFHFKKKRRSHKFTRSLRKPNCPKAFTIICSDIDEASKLTDKIRDRQLLQAWST